MNAPENMGPGGFVIWPRDELSDPLFRIETPNRQNAWMWLVFSARFADCSVKTSRGVVHLKRGQLAASDTFLVEAWKWSRTGVRRFLDRLQEAGLIRSERGQVVRVITICDYERFQELRAAAGHKSAKKRSGSGQNQDSTTPEDSQTAAQFGPDGGPVRFDLGMQGANASIPTMREQLLADGLPLLKALMGKDSRLGRSYLGKLLKLAEDDGQRVMDALADCVRVAPVCPRTWLMQAVRAPRGPKRDAGLAWMDGMGADDGPIIEGKLG